MADCTAELVEVVSSAARAGSALYLRGGDSKRHWLGRDCDAAELDVSAHCGITDYRPEELVISARAGTPVAEVEEALAGRGQMLPFEPARSQGRATLGGTLASNLSGPGRPWRGALRDAVLGVRMINGRGELLDFGGRVMKNVAGYDVSRLQAGALGTLGAITELHLKVLPRPESSLTLAFPVAAPAAHDSMLQRAREGGPLDAACWTDGVLYLRLSGAARAVRHTAGLWGGERVDDAIWEQLREFTHPFFAGDAPLWRQSCTPNAPLAADDRQLIDWGGAQRWRRGERPAEAVHGHLTLFAGGDRAGEVRGAVDPVLRRLHERLKQSLDPAGIFNPGRLYSWL